MGEQRRTQPNAPSERRGERRLTVKEAAEALGISTDAVRMRLSRGTLQRESDESGHVYVILPPAEREPNAGPNVDVSGVIEAKDELIASLREQLEHANERDRENRRIIAALTQRIPQIEAPARGATETPSEPPGEPQPTAATEQPGRVEPQPQVEGAERRSWWQRMFGA